MHIMIFMVDKDCLAICYLHSMALHLHSWIKLGLHSSEWDPVWYVDPWLHALDRNLELFSNYMDLTHKKDDVICEKSNLPDQH